MSIPRATYRLQFNADFNFRSACQIVDFLHQLGISHIYASPILKSRPQSGHGYDVVDPSRIDPELGEKKDLEKLVKDLRKFEMGWIQDIVPNHMAYSSENVLLFDVLENGPFSRYYNFFDINWNHHYENLHGKVLAPFLGKFYDECLENGEIKLKYQKRGLTLHYYQHLFPIRMESYFDFFSHSLQDLRRTLDHKHPDFIKYVGVLNSMKNISALTVQKERYEQTSFIKEMLWELYNGNEQINKCIQSTVSLYNGKAGQPETFDPLHKLINEQFYRLAFWKVGTEEINYRRFFNVNELISLKIEDDEVFYTTHRLILDLVREGFVDGLRIDHVDGLLNPTDYLYLLRREIGDRYLVVEKILEFSENLPEFWTVQGTTGYDFLNYVNGIFCDRKNDNKISRIYEKFIGFRIPYSVQVYEKKRLIVGKHMAGDVDNLAHSLVRISGRYRYGSDFTLYGLRRSLVEILSHFEIYRTYISHNHYRDEDRSYIHKAVEKAKINMPDLINELNFIGKILLLESETVLSRDEKKEWYNFIFRFQQLTGPLMAKGFEDTLLYNYNRFLSLNEVGGNPGKLGVSSIEFHYFNRRRREQWPDSMNTTSTHDTKRGEDIRARLNVLSEIPEEWSQHVRLWARINRRKKTRAGPDRIPDSNDEYFLYQTLIGSFPFADKPQGEYRQRLRDYVIKAVREAKVHTAWLKPDTSYEENYLLFLDQIMEESQDNLFLKEFLPFQRKIAWYGILNSLSQVLIKISSPGVPDFYQGSELWDLNLVDPDNRRAVDYNIRMKQLKEIERKCGENPIACIQKLFSSFQDGRIKLFLIRQLLKFRRDYPQIFREGNYLPAEIKGKFRRNLFSFSRQYGKNWIITITPRFLTELINERELPLGKPVWEDTRLTLPDGISNWREIISSTSVPFTGEVFLGDLFRYFPGALLFGTEE
jgi:(1->4)-alpha-D-glucan 1-alpha-D-glucosylmutase